MAGLCDAVAEIITGQPTDEEKAALFKVENADRADVERFYEGARAAFKREPESSVPLFFSVLLADVRVLSPEQRPSVVMDLLSSLVAVKRLGYISEVEMVKLTAEAEKAVESELHEHGSP